MHVSRPQLNPFPAAQLPHALPCSVVEKSFVASEESGLPEYMEEMLTYIL